MTETIAQIVMNTPDKNATEVGRLRALNEFFNGVLYGEYIADHYVGY